MMISFWLKGNKDENESRIATETYIILKTFTRKKKNWIAAQTTRNRTIEYQQSCATEMIVKTVLQMAGKMRTKKNHFISNPPFVSVLFRFSSLSTCFLSSGSERCLRIMGRISSFSFGQQGFLSSWYASARLVHSRGMPSIDRIWSPMPMWPHLKLQSQNIDRLIRMEAYI